MGKSLGKALKILAPLILGGFIIYISLNQFDQEQRETIWKYIQDADYSWIVLSVLLAFISHILRAWRWGYMVESLGVKSSFYNNIIAIGIGYAVNLAIPRGGEIARAGTISKLDGLPVDKALGTIVAERVLDLIILLTISGLAIFLGGQDVLNFFSDRLDSAFAKAELLTIILYMTVAVVIIITSFLVLKKLGLHKKIATFIIGLKEGFATIWTMEKKWSYLFHTVLIWALYVLMFYVSIFSLEATTDLPFAGILCAFVAGSFAVALINGGIGAYPFLVAQTLALFGLEMTAGTSLGWILWLSQTLLVIIYGLISLLLLSLKMRRGKNLDS
ncbi:MAG: lysylphosphatidylglycerol synthase transmembrane domain-containing protein [Nonlabens sp.]